MSKKIKYLFFTLIIFLIASCLILVVAEILARTLSGEPDENTWMGNTKRYYEYDPLLGWRRIPNLNETRMSVGGKNKVLYQINSKSIRGPEYSYKKAENEYRILILGDSFADGYMVEFDELFSEVMRTRLSSVVENKNFHVINSGTSGWSTDQELLFFQHEGKKYNPDVTILMFYQNDVAYNNQPKDWSMYYKPLFKIEDGSLILTNVPVPEPDRIVYYDQLLDEEKSLFKKFRRYLNEKK